LYQLVVLSIILSLEMFLDKKTIIELEFYFSPRSLISYYFDVFS
jgi:hypothetical protein